MRVFYSCVTIFFLKLFLSSRVDSFSIRRRLPWKRARRILNVEEVQHNVQRIIAQSSKLKPQAFVSKLSRVGIKHIYLVVIRPKTAAGKKNILAFMQACKRSPKLHIKYLNRRETFNIKEAVLNLQLQLKLQPYQILVIDHNAEQLNNLVSLYPLAFSNEDFDLKKLRAFTLPSRKSIVSESITLGTPGSSVQTPSQIEEDVKPVTTASLTPEISVADSQLLRKNPVLRQGSISRASSVSDKTQRYSVPISFEPRPARAERSASLQLASGDSLKKTQRGTESGPLIPTERRSSVSLPQPLSRKKSLTSTTMTTDERRDSLSSSPTQSTVSGSMEGSATASMPDKRSPPLSEDDIKKSELFHYLAGKLQKRNKDLRGGESEEEEESLDDDVWDD